MHRLIDESVQPVWPDYRKTFQHGQPVCTVMHSHHNLVEIFYYLWLKDKDGNRLFSRGGFHDLVFRLVMYHQSIDGCSKWPHMFTFSTEERDRFCDPTLFKLIKPLMIADSSSYNFLANEDFQIKTRQEFIASNDRIHAEWLERR